MRSRTDPETLELARIPSERHSPSSPFALRSSPFALRSSPIALRSSPIALRSSPFALRSSPFALRSSPFALRSSPFALRSSLLALLALLLLTGCRSEPLTIRTFVLAMPRRAAAEAAADPAPAGPSIALDRVRVNPVANQNRILVRGGDEGREIHWLEGGAARWELSPGDMAFEEVLRDLRECGKFGRVFLAGQRSADYVLHLELAALEIVVDQAGASRAVCEIDAQLVRNVREGAGAKESEILWTGRSAASVPLPDRRTESAVTALGHALEGAWREPKGTLAEIVTRTRQGG